MDLLQFIWMSNGKIYDIVIGRINEKKKKTLISGRRIIIYEEVYSDDLNISRRS